jgi:lincosamide nucleotidyltransferase A/C/D/E
MKSTQVADLFRLFAAAQLRVWLAGGWAVDALVGRQTRAHGDMDVAVDVRDVPALVGLLDERSFVVTTDWSPSRLELTGPDGQVIDIHPVMFAEDGSGRQPGHRGDSFYYAPDGFALGSINGAKIPCLSASQQLRFRQGYELRATDIHDVELLRKFR